MLLYRTVYMYVLRQNGRLFVDAFVQRGMPMLDHMFRAHRDNIQMLLKHLQLSTRALHHLCGHSKVITTVAVMKQLRSEELRFQIFDGLIRHAKKCVLHFIVFVSFVNNGGEH